MTASIDSSFKRVGAGELFLAPVPTTVPTTADEYYQIFYGSTGAAAKKVLDTGVTAYCNLTSAGINFKLKNSSVDFDPNNGPKTKMVTGIEEASVELSFYDVNPDHLANIFGAAADLTTVAASAGVAGRKIALLGPNTSNTPYVAMFRMPSPKVAGQFWHYLFPNANIVADLDLKLSKKDAFEGKIVLQLDGSPTLKNSFGFGVVAISDDATAAAL